MFTKCDAPYKPTVYFYGLALIEIGFFVLRDKLFRNVPFVVYNSHNFAGCKPRSDQHWTFSSLRRSEMDGIQDFQRTFPNRLTLIPRSLVSTPSSQLRATAIKNLYIDSVVLSKGGIESEPCMMNINAKCNWIDYTSSSTHKEFSLLYLHKSNSRDVVLFNISIRLKSEVSMSP